MGCEKAFPAGDSLFILLFIHAPNATEPYYMPDINYSRRSRAREENPSPHGVSVLVNIKWESIDWLNKQQRNS